MKDRSNYCKKGVISDICFSYMETLVKNRKEVIVDEFVWRKHRLRFLQLRLQLTEIAPQKSGLKQEKTET
jgi:hypothetical protein